MNIKFEYQDFTSVLNPMIQGNKDGYGDFGYLQPRILMEIAYIFLFSSLKLFFKMMVYY